MTDFPDWCKVHVVNLLTSPRPNGATGLVGRPWLEEISRNVELGVISSRVGALGLYSRRSSALAFLRLRLSNSMRFISTRHAPGFALVDASLLVVIFLGETGRTVDAWSGKREANEQNSGDVSFESEITLEFLRSAFLLNSLTDSRI